MAARTNTSIGVGVTITLLAVASLAFGITAMVFYAKQREAVNAREDMMRTSKDFLSDADRNDPIIISLKEAAKGKKTVVRSLLEDRKDVMSKSVGSDRATAEELTKLLEKAKAPSLAAALRDRDSEIESLNTKLSQSDAARQRALQDLENETQRVTAMEKSMKDTQAALTSEVDKTRAEAEQLREQVNQARKDMDQRVEGIRDDFAKKEAGYKADIDKLQASSVVDRERIKKFEQEQRGTRYAGQSEYALVDGQVIGTTAADGTVTLSIGRKQRVVLGLPFNVYAAGTTIKVDEKTGEYPPGKATIEVIRINEDTCVARILREQKGNPVIKGDIVANPIYDPTKSYKFLVYGNFDPQRTGNASAFGANEVKAWIRDWGGTVVDDLAGDVDFIVLGQRPQLPPQPSGTAPLEVINFYLNQQKQAARYDDLLKQATDTAIPVLNENRLRTLLGR